MKVITSFKYTAPEITGGVTDSILRIDLTQSTISIQKLDEDFKHKYIGGRGYALKLIWDDTTSETKYDSEENLLVMAGGPLCNEPRFPGTGKFVVGTISPLTNTFIDSNVGGFFAPILKACGFDAIAIKGISSKKIILTIDDDKGEIAIIEAPSFSEEIDNGGISYGKAILNYYTDNKITKHIAAVTTGIGAETTLFGLINSHFLDNNRKRLRTKQAGRGGTGTVMRYKNLMSVIVNSSKTRIKNNNPINPHGVKNAGGTLAKLIKEEDPKQLHLASWGTPVLVEYMNKFHILPINNYQYGQSDKAKQIFSDVFLNEYLKDKKFDGCYAGCNLACAKGAEDVTLTRGPHKGRTVGVDGPEYETAGAVTCLGIFDPHFIMEFNWYCDEYGVDTISMGVVTAFFMESFQRGFLSEEDIGYTLNWGDIENADRFIHDTCSGTGIGKIASQGINSAKKWIAEKHSTNTDANYDETLIELNKFAMEVKGLEFSMYISKESLAQQGGYGFALKGPQHDEAWLIFLDQVHNEMETFEMKTAALKWFPLIRTWFNAVGLCKLPWIDVRHPEAAHTENPAQNIPSFNLYIEYLNSTTGSEKNIDDILIDSERLHLLQKMINVRQGKGTREHDQIPLRAMGPASIEEFNSRSEYYIDWLNKNVKSEIPKNNEDKLILLQETRKELYAKLCDIVYKEKGYDNNGIPFSETLEKFQLYDNKAKHILKKHQ